jgi:membrane fusion protein (multidrug efflux system)
MFDKSQTPKTPLPSAVPPALTALALALSLAACGPSAPGGAGPGGPGGKMPPPEVSVITVEAKNAPVELEYTGQTAGSRETEVRARVAGILQRRLYQEGAAVKAGTPLFQIDPANFQTQLASAEAAVGVAQARLNQAQRDNTRLTPLIAEKAVSQKEYDDSKSALESAQAALKQAQAQANEARLNLDYTKVVAPISGVTGTASKSDGSLVSGTDSLLTTIVQTNPIYVNFSVSESDYLRMTAQVNSGQLTLPGKRAANGSVAFTVGLKLADGSMHPRPGKLNFASEKVNPATGSIDVRAEIPNPDGSLRPGQFVRVVLSGANRPNTISVPQRAVIDSPFGKMVFAVSPDNKLVPHPVELDGWTKGEWIVTKGITAGERILVEGFIKAHDPGMTVSPVPYVASAQGTGQGGAPAGAGKAPSEQVKPASSQDGTASSASK